AASPSEQKLRSSPSDSRTMPIISARAVSSSTTRTRDFMRTVCQGPQRSVPGRALRAVNAIGSWRSRTRPASRAPGGSSMSTPDQPTPPSGWGEAPRPPAYGQYGPGQYGSGRYGPGQPGADGGTPPG